MKCSAIASSGLVSLMYLGNALWAQNPPPVPFTLDVTAPAGKPLVLAVPAKGEVSLNLIRTGDLPTTGVQKLNITLSVFTDEQDGDSVPVDLVIGGGAKAPRYLGYDVSKAELLPLSLWVPALPNANPYTGRLNITGEGFAPTGWDLALKRPAAPQATLVASRQAITQEVGRSRLCRLIEWLCSNSQPFSVDLSDKTGKNAVEGLTVSLNQLSKAPGSGFDLTRNVLFTLNGKPIPDFQSTPPPQSQEASIRTVPVGGRDTVAMTLKGLTAGEYNAVLRFQGTNSVADDAQKVALTISVHDSWVDALLALFVALLFSFLGTKMLSAQRQRATFLGRIHDLRRPWLADEPAILPVVWVRALLREVESLSHAFWLTNPGQINDRVNQAASMLDVLEKIRQFRSQLTPTTVPDDLERMRANDGLNRIVARLRAEPLKDAEVTQITTDLNSLAGWLRKESREALYRADLQEVLGAFLPAVHPDEFKDAGTRQFVQELLAKTKTQADLEKLQVTPVSPASGGATAGTPPAPAAIDSSELERAYDILKILWERRGYREEVAALLDRYEQTGNMEAVFRLANQQVWERLKSSKDQLKIAAPGEDSEAYDTLRFSLSTGDSTIDSTYLFYHKLTYQWSFTLRPNTRTWMEWLRLRRRPPATPRPAESAVPEIVQFFPRPGLLDVEVELHYAGDPNPIKVPARKPLEIRPSSDFTTFRAFERVEVESWVLAGLAAIVTGLSTFYYNNPTFGSPKDYLALIAWGAGVDQTKNFLQQMQVYSTPSSAPQSAPKAP